MQNADSHNSQTTLPLHALIDTRHAFHHISSSKSTGHSDFFGQRISNGRGQGVEFVDLRQYTAGDDIRHIDWNVTARSNEPHTRLYREEREHTTTVVVDFRPCMFTGSQCLRAVRAGILAAGVLWRASDMGSRCSAVVVTHDDQRHSRPMAGKKGVLQACDLIAREFKEATRHASQQKDPPLTSLLNATDTPGKQADHCLVFSGFDSNHEENWQDPLTVCGYGRRMVGILILDPLETDSPPIGNYPYQTKSLEANATINKRNQPLLTDLLHDELDRIVHQFDRSGVPLIIHNTNHSESSVLAALEQRSLL